MNQKEMKDVKAVFDRYQPKLDSEYAKSVQVAKYTDLSGIDKANYLQSIMLESKGIGFVYDGNIQSGFENRIILYQMIQQMDKKIEQNTYTIVYLVANESGSTEFFRFLKIIKSLPMKYYLQMLELYVCHASLLMRTKLWFQKSRRSKLWQKKLVFISDLQDIQSRQWSKILPKQITNQIVQFEGQVFKQNVIFGVPLEQTKLNQCGIPILLDHLLTYFVINGNRYLVPDIFRKQGSLDEENQLQQLLTEENFDCLQIVDDVKIVCSMIKKFFTILPKSLIPEDVSNFIYNRISALNIEMSVQFLNDVFDQLPQLNRVLLSVMASFLIQVASYSEFNRMNLTNLAIVFAPCFMRPQTNDINQSLGQIACSVKFLKLLFESFEKMFPNFSFTLFLQSKTTALTSSTSSNSSTGTSNNKNQSLSSSEGEDKLIVEKLSDMSQKQ